MNGKKLIGRALSTLNLQKNTNAVSAGQWWRHFGIGLTTALVFALLYALGFFGPLEYRMYNFYLRFQPPREKTDRVVFLDVDDNAIAYNGVFPWPRSVVAEGLLRLKEYNAHAAIFDMEYIDKSPEAVDEVYRDRGFPVDFENSFREIDTNVFDLINAMNTGSLSAEDVDLYSEALREMIADERDRLFERAGSIARDNDVYLAQASSVFGRTWASLNLRSEPLTGEQAERRALAEKKFSYPLEVSPQAPQRYYADILPAITSFSQSAKGAGFTNVIIDSDGVRRRIALVQKVQDHWYLQLAFAPLIDSLGNPRIRLDKRSLTIKDADMPGKGIKDIVIPLDEDGLMLLNWPLTDYTETFTHISFADFSLLEDLEPEIAFYVSELDSSAIPFFAQYSDELQSLPGTLYRIREFLAQAQEKRSEALRDSSEEAYEQYLALREEGFGLIRMIIAPELGKAFEALALAGDFEDFREDALAAAASIKGSLDNLAAVFTRYETMSRRLKDAVEGKFCILGRVDSGTTDIGVNPFYGHYINVGTHGVLIDTILSEAFITPLPQYWSILLCALVPLLILVMGGLKPGVRAGAGLAGALLMAVLSFVLFYFAGCFLGILGPVLAMVIAVIVREIVSYMGSEKEKQFYRKAFATYTSEAVAEEIARNPELLKLGGDRRSMTAIFTDIRSFSTISEALKEPETGETDPVRLVNLLNVYLTRMSDIVLENQGVIDKYEGDAIIAFWGAPLRMADHALQGCRSAIAMKKAETEFNREARELGLIDDAVLEALLEKGIISGAADPLPILTRFGINTGAMVVGNMGTTNKMNYTIMGNAVNLAARLEGVNKQFGTRILASEDTITAAGNSILTRRLGMVRVVGILKPVALYEVLDMADTAPPETRRLAELFNGAMDAYAGRDWTAAEAAFETVLNHDPSDKAAKLYLDRCAEYRSSPPPAAWDGVDNLDQK
ncbi:MAG: CHASE2 domain-containing protein [Treponema sp.]|jgi:adenylate cyclase|nr:CHASE2 domain-containing protein [Treponema sp.]